MIEIKRILCPIDFSEHSRRALDHAVTIARWYESTVTVLHVSAVAPTGYAPGAPVFVPAALTESDRVSLAGEMTRFVETENAPGVPIEYVLRHGIDAGEIVDQAATMKADLLVMGTHGRAGFERLMLGSVTEKVLRKAECAVLTVPRGAPDAVPASPVLFKRILCPVDFSDNAMHALRYALSLAQEADAELTLLHVMTYEMDPTPDMVDSLVAEGRLTVEAFRRAYEERSRRLLEEAVPAEARAYCTIDTLLTAGKPWTEILSAAAERQSDLVVMGVRGHGTRGRTFIGSTTSHVVRGATCPVMTLRKD